MQHAHTIAIAQNLFAELRLREVLLLLEPLVRSANPEQLDPAEALIIALAERARLFYDGVLPTPERIATLASLAKKERYPDIVSSEIWLTSGWQHALNFESVGASYAGLHRLNNAIPTFRRQAAFDKIALARLGQAQAYGVLGETDAMRNLLDEVGGDLPSLNNLLVSYWYHDLNISRAILTHQPALGQGHLSTLRELNQTNPIPYAKKRLRAYSEAVAESANPAPEPSMHAASDVHCGSVIEGLICLSSPMKRLSTQVHHALSGKVPVLYSGENGTGKAWIARQFINKVTRTRKMPVVSFDCRAWPSELLTDRIFGTGVDQENAGALEQALGGVLFLEAIDVLPEDLQQALNTFLHAHLEKGFSEQAISSFPFLFVATAESEKHLIPELQMLFSGSSIVLPPLRERKADIPGLVRVMLRELHPPGMPLATVTTEALESLLAHSWPGNARQLHNELERILYRTAYEPLAIIDRHHLSPEIRVGSKGEGRFSPNEIAGENLETMLAHTEKHIIEQTLESFGGQVTATAAALGLTRQGLYKKMKRLSIQPKRFSTSGRKPAPPNEALRI